VTRDLRLSWLAAAVAVGIAAGLGVVTLGYADGLAYLRDDPAACANCHVMQEQWEGWRKGRHAAVATCNDCHVPHDFAGKWLSKARNGYHHSRAFTLQDFHEPIRITPRNAAALQQGCLHCHAELVHAIAPDPRGGAGELVCAHCHRDVGHGPTE
jgi:cytochrome c nitrite reductase small subunit